MQAALRDCVCLYSQRAAEGYLKSLLQEQGLPVPRAHDLLALLAALVPQHRPLLALRRGLAFLTRFAEGPGYPGFYARKRQAVAALRWSRRVREACRSALRIKPPRRRKK